MNLRKSSWHYHSEAPPQETQALAEFQAPAPPIPQALKADPAKNFQISFNTHTFKPNHIVTIRTNVDGWDRDIHGTYWYGAWRFILPNFDYLNGCEFKFVLDKTRWHAGSNLTVTHPHDVEFNEQEVVFDNPEARFIHGYENLRVSEDSQQQNLLQSSYSEETLWDVIVIGSGMGGGTLADALTDAKGKQIKVLVLDAGSFDYPTHLDNLPVNGFGRPGAIGSEHEVRHYHNESNSTQFGMGVQMNLGGRSLFWSGIIPRMRGWELSNWPQPVASYLTTTGYDNAEAMLRKHITYGKFQEDLIADLRTQFPAWTICETPRSSHQPELGTPANPDVPPASFLYSSTGTFSTAELLLDSLNSDQDPGKGRLFVNLNHLVTRIEHFGPQVTGVVCQDLVGNRERTYRAKFVVLAAGSIESPKIALQSGLHDPDDRIGVGLTDHPSYYAPDGYHGGDNFYLKPTSPYAGEDKHARIFFYPNQPWNGHWFNVEIVLNGHFWRVRHIDDDILNASTQGDKRTTVKFKVVFGSPLQDGNYVRLGGPEGRLWVKHLPNPNGGNAHNDVIAFLDQLVTFFRAEPVNWNNPGNCHFGNGGTVNHAGGTLRMGATGTKRVVDENLKFLSYDNLYVCDPSVYPYIPAANPSLTLVALSLRLAEHLAAKF